jgi:hypothetical protein
MGADRYIFNHIPKTGGISFLEICRYNLAASEVSPHLVEDEALLGPSERYERYRLIAGHFSIPAHARFSAGRYSMTLLRDPIRRIVSTYTFWRAVPEINPLTAKAKELPFSGFVRYFMDSPIVIQSPFTHHFAVIGKDFPCDPADPCALLAAAKRNLAAFDFIGICEEFECSTRLLCAELGWRLPVPFPHLNRSGSENALADIDEGTMEILRDRNQLDFELYRYGCSLFAAREQRNQNLVGRRSVSPTRFVPFVDSCAPRREASIQAVSARWVPDSVSKMLLELAIEFHTIVPNAELSLGVAIYDAAGSLVWGTNTWNEKLEVKNRTDRDSHATFILEFQAPAGVYSVTAAIHKFRRLGFHDHWIDGAASFEVSPQLAVAHDMRSFRLHEFRSTVIQDD